MTAPFSNSSPTRMASVSLTVAVSPGSTDGRSVIVAVTGRPGRNFTPPEAK